MAGKSKEPVKMGRPTIYKPEYARQARVMVLQGHSDEEIAFVYSVDLPTIAKWAWDNEEFYKAITPTDKEREEWNNAQNLLKEKRRKAKANRLYSSAHNRIENSFRARMWAALKGKTSGKCLTRLGYSIDDLKLHLQKNFVDGMTWDNYGDWHIDHIKPCVLFDMADDVQFNECWALSNLQPLWASDNVRKGASYDGSQR